MNTPEKGRRGRALLAGVMIAQTIVLGACGRETVRPDSLGTRWTMTEIARFGGAEEGLASLNVILDLQFAHDSGIWVLDGQTQTIRRFDLAGGEPRIVARRGKGPGELEMANGMRPAPGGEMWARDFGNQRLSRYDSAGRFVGQHILPPHSYEYRWGATVDSAGRVVDMLYVRDADSLKRVIVSFAPDGSGADTSAFPTRCSDQPIPAPNVPGRDGGFVGRPYAPELLMRLAAQGDIWCGRTDRYALRRFSRGQDAPVAQVNADSGMVPVSAAARDSSITEMEEELRRIGGPAIPWNQDMVPHSRPAIRSLVTDDQDRLWVMRDRADGSAGFDVWDRAGARLATVDLDGSLRPASTFRVHRGMIAIIVRDEHDVPSVAVFRISEQAGVSRE
jgi:hypothetical protein